MTSPPILCPSCGSVAKRTSTKYGDRHDCCGLWSWAGKPLADADTHAARQAAHAAFDPIWKLGRLSRGRAYRLLAQELNVPEPEAHMSIMSADLARRVPAAVASMLARQS